MLFIYKGRNSIYNYRELFSIGDGKDKTMLTREMLAPHTALLLRYDLFEGIQADDLTALVNALDGELKHYAAGQNIMRMGGILPQRECRSD